MMSHTGIDESIPFVESRTVLVLCLPFFDSEIHKVYLTPRYLIHEAGALSRSKYSYS